MNFDDDQFAFPEDVLDSIAGEANPRLAEATFFTRYLPLTLHEDPGLFSRFWLAEVAKFPGTEVDIINEVGEVLYTVPPTAPAVEVVTSDDFVEILSESVMQGNIAPVVQHNFLNANLPSRITCKIGDVEDIRRRWIAIFTRYNGLDRAKEAGFIDDAATKERDQSIGVVFDDD